MKNGSGENPTAPLYVSRYEDMYLNPEAELEGIMKFILDLEDLEGTNVERRIKEVIAAGDKATHLYALKDTTGKMTANVEKYNEEQVKYIKDKFGDMLYFFGYTNHPEQENPTALYEFDEHTPENLAKFNGFRKQNENAIKLVAKSTHTHKLPINDGSKENNFHMFDKEFVEKTQLPGLHEAKKALKIEAGEFVMP